MPTVKEKLKGFGGGGGGAVAVGSGGNFELIEVGLWFAVYLNPRDPIQEQPSVWSLLVA